MGGVACHVCGLLGGVGASLLEAADLARCNGFDVHPGGESHCPRHRALCVRCHPVQPSEPCSPWLVVELRARRLVELHPAHIVASVRAHRRERWAREYADRACSELRRRPGWDEGRILLALGPELVALGLLDPEAEGAQLARRAS